MLSIRKSGDFDILITYKNKAQDTLTHDNEKIRDEGFQFIKEGLHYKGRLV